MFFGKQRRVRIIGEWVVEQAESQFDTEDVGHQFVDLSAWNLAFVD